MYIDPLGLAGTEIGDALGAFHDGGYEGYSEAVQARKDALNAVDNFTKHMRLRDKVNSVIGGRGDAIRHCVLACSLTQRLGRKTAKSILDRHESRGPMDLMDERNNQMGCFIGENSEPGNCEEECLKNIFDLMVMDKNNQPVPLRDR